MHKITLGRVGDQHLNTEPFRDSSLIELLLHGEAGTQQTNTLNAICGKSLSRGIGNMQQWNRDRGGNLWGYLVHGIGADQHEVGTASLYAAGRLAENLGSGIPVTGVLQAFNLGKIDAVEAQLG